MQNDGAYFTPELSLGAATPTAPAPTKRRKLQVPGVTPQPEVNPEPSPSVKIASVAQPLTPPPGSKPSVHLSAYAYQPPEMPAYEDPVVEIAQQTQVDTQVASEAEVHIQSISVNKPTRNAPTVNLAKSTQGSLTTKTVTQTSGYTNPYAQPVRRPKKGMPEAVKVLIGVVVVIIVIIIIVNI
jgi:hypothetical protein